MKRFIIWTSCFLAIGFSSVGQNNLKSTNDKIASETKVKQFWFVLLTKGNNRTQDSVTAAKIQQGHMANITRLYNEGKIKVAGPYGDDGNWRGIFVFDAATKEEVETLLTTDPAISSGRLSYEIHPWWTSPVGSFKWGRLVEELERECSKNFLIDEF